MNLISLNNVKLQLGIMNNSYDTDINSMIPIVSSDIRRILNCSYSRYVVAQFSSSNAEIILSLNNYYQMINTSFGDFELGQVVTHTNIPQDTYLSAYNPETGRYTLSATPTGSGSYVYPTIKIGMLPTIAKMVWYKIQKRATNSVVKTVSSETYGSVSVTYADSEINKRYDYPQQLINDLGIPYVGIG